MASLFLFRALCGRLRKPEAQCGRPRHHLRFISSRLSFMLMTLPQFLQCVTYVLLRRIAHPEFSGTGFSQEHHSHSGSEKLTTELLAKSRTFFLFLPRHHFQLLIRKEHPCLPYSVLLAFLRVDAVNLFLKLPCKLH